MFVTDIRARDHFMSQLAGDGMSMWHSVQLALRRPWFLVSYRVTEGPVSVGETKLLANVAQVLELVSQTRVNTEPAYVTLIYPADGAVPCRWTMAPVERIWKATRGGGGPSISGFDLSDGNQYWDSFGGSMGEPNNVELVLDLTGELRLDR